MKQLAGKWIAVDGIDAVGKTTQVAALKQHIEASGIPTVVLPEWSNSLLGKTIEQIVKERRFYALHTLRKTPFADTYSLIADITYKIEAEGAVMLQTGGVVLSDRGLLSLIGYQAKRAELYGGMPIGEAVDLLTHIIRSSLEHLRIPDHHVFLTIEENEMQRRIFGRGEPLMDTTDRWFLADVRAIMEQVTVDIDTTVLEVTGLNEKEVTDAIIRSLLTRFPEKAFTERVASRSLPSTLPSGDLPKFSLSG